MRLDIQRIGGIVVITPAGRFDNLASMEVGAACYRLIDEGMINFVFDLSDTEFLDSAGMAVLVSVLKRVRRLGGETRLVNPQAQSVRHTLRLTKFDRVFQMTPNVTEAVATFARV